MSDKSKELLDLYQALLQKVKEIYQQDTSLTVKSLLSTIKKGKEYLALKRHADEAQLQLVEEFLQRDVASFIATQAEDDLSYSPTAITLENTLWHWLGEISDRSQVEWHELARQFSQKGVYHSGDIVTQGTLTCTNCGHKMNIEFTDAIPDCPECDHSEFTREPLMP
ncbi:zinc ribbon-containing protein [Shewanella yunxiaonensis]|uniref:Zinc ribbon-containing protein n=1 Tax=Shewanella yunxiaonensis TaxID=2829809 RepID=A0ABX7YRS6_9GAMM|nr:MULTISPECIES: zinc ribbon-containing protein [Shewanella]MDF0533858.1 zinc ribbon-containing protein [Shewanella sp. A32]QUN05044.1 zinc ribbon-containing protein [Shewanella yunxiaonensis]